MSDAMIATALRCEIPIVRQIGFAYAPVRPPKHPYHGVITPARDNSRDSRRTRRIQKAVEAHSAPNTSQIFTGLALALYAISQIVDMNFTERFTGLDVCIGQHYRWGCLHTLSQLVTTYDPATVACT